MLFHDLSVGYVTPLIQVDSKNNGFDLKPGVHLLIAPNGVGKSCFVQTLAGVVKPLRGRFEATGGVFLMPEYLIFPKFIYPSEWAQYQGVDEKNWNQDPLLKPFRLEPVWQRYFGQMSQGERRKVHWVCALKTQKKNILLDEPLNGLDLFALEGVYGILKAMKDQGKTVLLITHHFQSLASIADGIWLIRDKKIIPGPSPSSLNLKGLIEFYQPQR